MPSAVSNKSVISGIYRITNILTKDFYIGSTVNFRVRKRTHFRHLSMGIHCNIHLQRAYNLYGVENFIFEEVEYCEPSKDYLIEREQYWITLYNPKYNIARTAGRTTGVLHSNLSKKKMSESKKNLSDEARRNISKGQKGKVLSEEHKRKISEALKNPSEEYRKRMSESRKASNLSAETRRNLSKARLGNTNCVGYKHTDETKERMSKSAKLYRERLKESKNIIEGNINADIY